MSNRKRKEILEIASNFEGNLIDYVEKLTKERDLYKSVLNEVRRYMNTLCDEYADDNYDIKCEVLETICQKLDKVGDK